MRAMRDLTAAACIAAVTVCSHALPAVAQDIVSVGEERFQSVDGAWFQLDDGDEQWKVIPGVIVVRFDSAIDSILVPITLADLSLTLLWPRPDIGGYYRFSYDSSVSPPAILEATRNAAHVVAAYLDTELKFFGDPDPYFENQWNLIKARVDKAWEISSGTSDLTIAILDAGFQIDHEDLVESLWTNTAEANGDSLEDDDGNGYVDDIYCWDFVPSIGHPNGDNNVEPVNSGDRHGTAVAGIACASTKNGKGIAGTAGGRDGNRPKLLMLRIYGISNVAPAIEYAWRAGADIISWSGGGYGDAGGAGSVAIDSVYANGVLFFGALGNSATPSTYFPATHPDVIGVGSTDENDVRVCSSGYGSHLDIMGPSASLTCLPSPEPYIWTTDNDGLASDYNPGDGPCGSACAPIPPENSKYFGKFVGTSAACPLVAAVGGLLKSHFPTLTSDQLRDRLFGSTIDLGVTGRDDDFGYGRVDAYRALTEWGTITEDVTWSPSDTHNGVRYVAGDLTIAPGATLTIMPGTIIKIANDDDLKALPDTARIEINVEGTLVVNGTATNPVIFKPWHPTTTEDWVGIYFDSLSGGGTFNHCIIKRAEYAIESYVPLTVRNTEIDSCRYAGIVSEDGGALLKDCEITRPGTFGVFLTMGASVVRNTLVDAAASAGVHVQPNADLIVRGSTLQNCDTGLYVNGNATVDVDSTCYVWMNDTGIHFYNAGSSSTIKGCGITWNTNNAILCDNASHPRIESNTLAHNGSGIYCSNSSSPIIESNKIQTSGVAVTATSSSAPDVGHSSPGGGQSAGNNSIAFTDKYVSNSTGSAIYAQHNCWNVNTAPCSPASNKFTGSVDRSGPICCSFPLFPRGEGEPEPSQFVFQLPPPATAGPGPLAATGLVAIVPNPFNPTTTVQYSLASQSRVEINIYDVAGRLVEELVRAVQVPGRHSAVWNGTDRAGSPVASGVYFVRMAATGQTFTRKMILLK